MSEEGVERRLTTILAADVVGYSRLMAGDESGTFAQLKAHRKDSGWLTRRTRGRPRCEGRTLRYTKPCPRLSGSPPEYGKGWLPVFLGSTRPPCRGKAERVSAS